MNYIKKEIIFFVLIVLLFFNSFFIYGQNEDKFNIQNIEDSLERSKSLNDVVQVAFRKIKKNDVLGGVSTLNVSELMDKNYFTYSLENMEGYIGGYNGNMWGMNDRLILVDGVPRDVNNVTPSEIEEITFLKGASAVVLYGSRAAKGVIYIKTKRGKAEKQKINIQANTGLYVPKSYPKYLGSAEYMTLYNEACINDGLEAPYDAEEIYNYASGLNPYRYPDVHFYSSDYLKRAQSRSDITTEISGGNDRARFYANIGFQYTGTQFNFGEAKNNRNTRFNVRGNVDVKLNDWISTRVDATASFYDNRSANGDYWSAASSLRPHRVSPLIPLSYLEDKDESSWLIANNSNNLIDGKYLLGGTQLDQTNIFADYYVSGHNKFTSRQFQFNTNLDMNLSKVLEGLSFQALFAVDYSTSYNQSYNNKYAVYQALWNNYSGEDRISSLTKFGEDEKTGIQNVRDSWNLQTIAFSGQFNYNRTFNLSHNVSSMIIASGYQQSESAVYHKTSNASLGFQLGYNYAQKYYVDFSGAAVHSARFSSSKRQAFSPSLSLGWRLSKEDFLENTSCIDDLMLTASVSVLNTDLDVSEYYMYDNVFTQTEGAWWGWGDGKQEKSTDSRRGENRDLSFVKRKEFSVGANASLWQKLINLNTSFFISEMKGLLVQPSTVYPMYFMTHWPNSSFLPWLNYNNDRTTGLDFSMNFHKQMNKVNLDFGFSGTYYKTKATRRDENYEFSHQNRSGRPIDGRWGLISDGFFDSEEDIEKSPKHTFGEVKPGDIKYIDQNGDGVIDSRDEVYLGRAGWSGAPFTMGVNFTMKWNNFTFFALGTGHFGGYGMKDNSYYWNQGDGKYSEVVRNRWTEETKSVATYPRLTSMKSNNNFRPSDFWLYKTNRFNLAKIQITYDFPTKLFKNTFLTKMSAYASGSNLLTISKEREILEMNIGSAPQTRFYNLGVKVVF